MNTVPFSPVPAHIVEMKFEPEDTYTYRAAPLAEMYRQQYRAAAIRLAVGEPAGAEEAARQGIAMEDAYMARARAEVTR